MKDLPVNWVLGFVLGLVASVLFVGVYVFIAFVRVQRVRKWPVEQARRRSLPLVTANVDACFRITDRAARLDVSVEPPQGTAYRDRTRVRLRGIVHLPPEVVRRLEVDETLPIRFDANDPHASTVDLAALLGRTADDEERAAYLQRGTPRWELLR